MTSECMVRPLHDRREEYFSKYTYLSLVSLYYRQ